ncbi:MAG: hypothetical protein KF893_10125 [Caldilineaceae bacterium]|nr:hypothetical protein [Caldilineaceae bacterium]
MSVMDMLQQIKSLSDADKLTLARATIQMVQESLQFSAQNPFSLSDLVFEIDLDDYFEENTRETVIAEIHSFLSMPDPEPEYILKCGVFKGRIPVDEDDFRIAEWRLPENLIND